MKRQTNSSKKTENKIKKLPIKYFDLLKEENPYAVKMASYIIEKFPNFHFKNERDCISELFTNRFIAHTLLEGFKDNASVEQFIKFYASFVLAKHEINEIEFYKRKINASDFFMQNINQKNLMRENKLHLPLYATSDKDCMKYLISMLRYIEFQIVYQKNFLQGDGLNKKITNSCLNPKRFEMDYAHERMQDFFEFLEIIIGCPTIRFENKKIVCPPLNRLNNLLKKNDLSEKLAFDYSVYAMNELLKFIKYDYSKEFLNDDSSVKEEARKSFQIIQKEIGLIQNRKLNLNKDKLKKLSDKEVEKIKELDNAVKENYYRYCESCLNDEFKMFNESLQWELLTQGMKVCRYYNQNIADRLYEKCYSLGEYRGCLNILNAPAYPSTKTQIEYFITDFYDKPDFEKDYYEFLINYDKRFLQSSYEAVASQKRISLKDKECSL